MVEAPHQVQGIITYGEGGGQKDVGGDTIGDIALGQLDVAAGGANLRRGIGSLAGEEGAAWDIDRRKAGAVVNVVIIVAGAID